MELFSRKLDRLAAKLSAASQQVLAALTEVTAEHSQTATESFSQFHTTYDCRVCVSSIVCMSHYRYQLHWTDACYVEEVKRSLTNLQLSIRSVVANSNSQASELHDVISRLQESLEEVGTVCV